MWGICKPIFKSLALLLWEENEVTDRQHRAVLPRSLYKFLNSPLVSLGSDNKSFFSPWCCFVSFHKCNFLSLFALQIGHFHISITFFVGKNTKRALKWSFTCLLENSYLSGIRFDWKTPFFWMANTAHVVMMKRPKRVIHLTL